MPPHNRPILPWNDIDTVLLDMDGTLLDLHFDNHFWLEHVPLRFAQKHGMDLAAAKAELYPRFRAIEGTLNWYCVDHWTAELGLDIALLKDEVNHLIAVHPYVEDFLRAARAAGKTLALVTNAHMKALALKFRCTPIGSHFDRVISSHSLGMPKEQADFWHALQRELRFAPARSVLIDDSLPVLRAARGYGIGHLLAIRKPDSRGPEKHTAEFAALTSFRDLLPIPARENKATTYGG